MTKISNLFLRYKQNNIVRHSIELFFTQGFASVIALLNTSLMAKGLGIEAVGIIGTIVAYAMFFDGLLNFQSYSSVIKFGSDAIAKDDTDRLFNYISMAFFQDVLTAFLACILGGLCLNFVSSWLKWSEDVKTLATIYLISIPMNINGSTNGVLRLNDKFTYTGAISIITNVLKTIGLIATMLLFELTIRRYLVIELSRIFLYNATVFIVSYRVNKKKYGKTPYHFHIKFDKEFTKYNIYNNLLSTIDMPTGQVVNLLINRFLGFQAVGVYTILTKLGSIVAKITSPISQSMLPELSRLIAVGQKRQAWSIGKKMFKYINLAGLACVGVMCATYRLWMPFFLDATIENNAYFGLYILYLAFTAASVGIHAFFIANNYVKINLYISIICNIFYLLLLFFTIEKFELFAVIISLLLQAVMVICCKLLYVNRIG